MKTSNKGNIRAGADQRIEQQELLIREQQAEIERLKKELESKEAGHELREFKESHLAIFDQHPFSLMIYCLENLQILEVNETAIAEYGYTKEEFLKLKISDLHDSEEAQHVEEHVSKIKSGQEFEALTWFHTTKSGKRRAVKINGASIVYRGKHTRLVVIEDISLIRKLEEINESHEKQLRELVERSSDLIYRISTEGYFLFTNNATCELTGYSREELKKTHFTSLVREDYQKRLMSFYEFQLSSETASTYTEFPIITMSGTEVWLGQNVDVTYNQYGNIEITAIAREITERKIFEKALLKSEDRYRSIIENMQLGMLEVDTNGVILKANKSFCAIVGYSAEEIEGTQGLFMLEEKGLAIMNTQQKERKRGHSGVYEIQLVCKDGSHKWVMISGAPFYDQNNRLAGTIGIHLDITHRKRMEGQLIESKTIAENSLRTKDVFLANISHEIRTPLNAIIGLSELLDQSELSPSQAALSSKIASAGKNLLNLINDILLLAKAEAKGIEIIPEWRSINEIVSGIFDLFSEEARIKGIEYRMELSIDSGRKYLVDALRFTQILQNLLSNAIKFTKVGGVHLMVTSTDTGILVIIKDTGIGIPSSDQRLVFNDFTQASNNAESSHGGTGLGLSIVHHLVQLMNGEIELNSSEAGTEFVLTFPLESQENGDQEEATSIPVEIQVSGTRQLRLLVAEDNDINQFLIQQILDKWKIDYDVVANGQQVLDALKSESYDAVLIDIRMPVMDGVEATRRIRDEMGLLTLPIIALTAHVMEEEYQKYWSAGMDDIITKPFTQDDLQRILNVYTGENPPEIQQLLRICDNKKDFAQILRKIFIEDCESRLVALTNNVENNDLETAQLIIHTMRPSLLQLSPEFISLVSTLENADTIDDQFRSQLLVFKRRANILLERLIAGTL